MGPDNFNKDEGTKDSRVKQSTALPTNTPAPSEVRISTVKRSESIGTEHKLVKGLDKRADIDGRERWKMMKESENTMSEWMVRRWNAIKKSPEEEKDKNKLFVDFISAKLKDIPEPTEAQIATACAEYVKDDIHVHEAALFVEGIGGALESAGFTVDMGDADRARKKLKSSKDKYRLQFGDQGQSTHPDNGNGNSPANVIAGFKRAEEQWKKEFKEHPLRQTFSPLFILPGLVGGIAKGGLKVARAVYEGNIKSIVRIIQADDTGLKPDEDLQFGIKYKGEYADATGSGYILRKKLHLFRTDIGTSIKGSNEGTTISLDFDESKMMVSPDLLKNMFGDSSIHKVSDLEYQMGKIVLARLDYYTSQGTALDTLDPKILVEGTSRINIANWHNELNGLTPEERKGKLAEIVKKGKEAAEKTAKEAVKKKQEETDRTATKKLVEELQAVESAKNTPEAIAERKKAMEREKKSLEESRKRVDDVVRAIESLEVATASRDDLKAQLGKITIKIDSQDVTLDKVAGEGTDSISALEKSLEAKKKDLKGKEAEHLKKKLLAERMVADAKTAFNRATDVVNAQKKPIDDEIKRRMSMIQDMISASKAESEGANESPQILRTSSFKNGAQTPHSYREDINVEKARIETLIKSRDEIAAVDQRPVQEAEDELTRLINQYEDAKQDLVDSQKEIEDKIKSINDAITAVGATESVTAYRSKIKEVANTTARLNVFHIALTEDEKKNFDTTSNAVSKRKALPDFLTKNTQDQEAIQKRIDHAETPEAVQKLTTFLEAFYTADHADAAHKIMEANFKKADAGELASWDDNASFLKKDYNDPKSLGHTRTYIRFLQLAFDKSGNTMTAEGKAGDAMRAKYMALIPEDDFYKIIGITTPTSHDDDLTKLNGLSQEQCMAVFVQLREAVRTQRNLDTPSSEIYPETKKILDKASS